MTTIPKYVEPQHSQPHCRIGIRKWVVELMKVNTDLGGRWWASRPNPLFLDELPCGLVYFSDEGADHQQTAPRNYLRSLDLVCEAVHRMESKRENALDDWLDSRAYEIENAMLSDRFLGQKGLIEDTILVRTQPTTIEDEGDADIGTLRVFFRITYRTGFHYKGRIDEFLKFLADIKGTEGENISSNTTIRSE